MRGLGTPPLGAPEAVPQEKENCTTMSAPGCRDAPPETQTKDSLVAKLHPEQTLISAPRGGIAMKKKTISLST